MTEAKNEQIKSKRRVADHGEVLSGAVRGRERPCRP